MRKPKLELTWIGKENRPRLEPRILLPDADRSYHAAHRIRDSDQFDSRILLGELRRAIGGTISGELQAVPSLPRHSG